MRLDFGVFPLGCDSPASKCHNYHQRQDTCYHVFALGNWPGVYGNQKLTRVRKEGDHSPCKEQQEPADCRLQQVYEVFPVG